MTLRTQVICSILFAFLMTQHFLMLSIILAHFGQNQLIETNINIELAKINDWLKINELSLNKIKQSS